MTERPKCKCGNLGKKHRINSKGEPTYHSTCSTCQKAKNKQGIPGNRGGNNRTAVTMFTRKFKKESCEECGFIPKHHCQLDVDHIDGNRLNNKENNFKTLCANCHRLKTFMSKDFSSLYL